MHRIDLIRVSHGDPRRSWCLGVGTALAWLMALGPLAAQDRVTVQRPGQSSRVTVIGRIQDFNGIELVLQTGAGNGVSRFPFAEVVAVTTRYTDAHEQSLRLMKSAQWREAWDQLALALDAEDRTWVRREILALQVQAALQLRNYAHAVSRFVAITQSDNVTPHYRLIPLVWTEQAPAEVMASEARVWLKSDDLVMRLIGASWLLSGPDDVDARFALSDLAGESHPYIQRLAQAQLWRMRLAEGNLSAPEIRRWEQLVEQWSVVLRPGPTFLIGRGFALRQEWLSAVAAWMWLPLSYPERRDLAVEAQWRAAQGLELAGDNGGAYRLTQEIIDRFADSPQAASARKLAARLSADPPRATMP